MDDSGRPDRRAARCRTDQQKPPGPNDRPAPNARSVDRRLRARAIGIRVYPAGHGDEAARRLDAVFQMHYTANGKATTDRTQIGLMFAKAPPKTRSRFASLINGGAAHSGRRRRRARRRRDDDQPRRHVVEHAAAHARARQALDLRSDVSRTAARRRCCRCRTTTSTGRPTTSSSSR